jgi:hypothetical protein
MIPGINGLDDARARGRLTRAPAGPALLLLARLSRARVQLAQGDAAARRRRIPRDRAPISAAYGRTTGWDADYDGDVGSFRMLNLARDALGLVHCARLFIRLRPVIGHGLRLAVSPPGAH